MELSLTGYLRPACTAILVLAIGARDVIPAAFAATPMTRADYEACQAADEAGFRRAIETLSLKTLQEGLKTVDYRALVDAQWRRQGMDGLGTLGTAGLTPGVPGSAARFGPPPLEPGGGGPKLLTT